jgi:glycosyltransferase involved in cell wall biosynthesis
VRIALITPGFSADERDWCIPVLLNLVRELAREHEVHVFTLRYPHRRAVYRVHGATVHAFGGALATGTGRLPLLSAALASIVRQGHHRPFDVLHALWADEPGFLAAVAGRLLGAPAVVSLLGGELVGLPDIGYGVQLSPVGRWLVRIALGAAAKVTVGSTYLQRLAQPRVAADRLLVMPLGVDTRLFYPTSKPVNPAPLAEGKLKLLNVASLVPVKDQATLLRALSRVVSRVPGVHLHIVGAGPLRRELECLAEGLGVAPHVTFHGAVPHDRLPDWYRAADLCVLSSRFESQGMVALEAAACARPTVGTAVGLLPDLVPATWTVPVGDDRALAEVLCTTLQDPRSRATMGQASLEAVRDGYTLEATVRRLSALYSVLPAV